MMSRRMFGLLIALVYQCSYGMDIFEAIYKGNLPRVQELIAEKVDVNQRPSWPPISVAIQKKDLKIVNALIKAGADVNLHAPDGYTPLTAAAQGAGQQGDLKIIKALIRAGADVNLPGVDGFTPLYYAVALGNLELTKLLIRKGAKVNTKNNVGSAPLHQIVYNNWPDTLKVIEVMIHAGADVNLSDNLGRTPLILAVSFNQNKELQKDIVKALLHAGAKLNIKDNDGKTAVDVAQNKEIKDILRKFSSGSRHAVKK